MGLADLGPEADNIETGGSRDINLSDVLLDGVSAVTTPMQVTAHSPLEAAAELAGVRSTKVTWERIFPPIPLTPVIDFTASDLAITAMRMWNAQYGKKRCELLDLGCGAGSDAAFYAAAGFDVTAVDSCATALSATAECAQLAGVDMTRIHCDMRRLDIRPPLHFVHACNSLEILGDECLHFLAKLQSATAAGGMHAVRVLTQCSAAPGKGITVFDRNELKLLYRGWLVLCYSEDLLWHESLGEHIAFARVVAIKQ